MKIRVRSPFVGCLVLAGATALAGPPVLTDLQPRGAERGRPFTLTLVGRNLIEGTRITSPMPARFTALTPATPGGGSMMMAPDRYATFMVEPESDMPIGVYPIRVDTPEGISNVLLFSVGTFPETQEQESLPGSLEHKNDTIETAEAVQSAPVVVNGTLRGAERDMFRVFGKAGERRVFEVEARRCGSAIDPVIRLLDGNGKQLARNEDAPGAGLDARIDFTFPKEGYYYVEIADARFSRQDQNFYRLKMGSYAYAEDLFPLGGRRGQTVDVTMSGPDLPAPVAVKADLKKAVGDDAFATVSLPDSPALPMVFAVSDFPEYREPVASPVSVPAVINGRLSRAGEIDRHKFTVTPGDSIMIELEARDLGTSKLVGIVAAYDSAGKKLASAGDEPIPINVFAATQNQNGGNSVDPFLTLKVPEGVKEITVSVEDLALRGGAGYSYRLVAQKSAPDFRASLAAPFVNIPSPGTAVVAVSVQRRGYLGPIQVKVDNAPPGLIAEGGLIPAEEPDVTNAVFQARRAVLSLTAPSGLTFDPQSLIITAEGKLADGTVLRRRATGPGLSVSIAGATAQGVVDRQRPLTAPWLGIELPAATTTPPAASLEVTQVSLARKASGDEYLYRWTWTPREPDLPVPSKVNVDIVGARDIRVIEMKADGNSGTFIVSTTKQTAPAKYDLYVSGLLGGKGGEEVYARRLQFEVLEGEPGAKPTAATTTK